MTSPQNLNYDDMQSTKDRLHYNAPPHGSL